MSASVDTVIEFCDIKGIGNSGYAAGWFFWVHKASKDALDVRYHEVINESKTLKMRNSRAVRLGYASLNDFRRHLKSQDVLFGDDPEYAALIKHAVRDSVERQGVPPSYSFSDTDRFESRCGRWYLIVTQATPDRRTGSGAKKAVAPGSLSFDLMSRSPNEQWRKVSSHTCSQSDFVDLLRDGAASSLELRPSLLTSQMSLLELDELE